MKFVKNISNFDEMQEIVNDGGPIFDRSLLNIVNLNSELDNVSIQNFEPLFIRYKDDIMKDVDRYLKLLGGQVLLSNFYENLFKFNPVVLNLSYIDIVDQEDKFLLESYLNNTNYKYELLIAKQKSGRIYIIEAVDFGIQFIYSLNMDNEFDIEFEFINIYNIADDDSRYADAFDNIENIIH
jgi:hypothetical protein